MFMSWSQKLSVFDFCWFLKSTSSILKHLLHCQWIFYHCHNSHVNKSTYFWKPLATSFLSLLAKYTLSPHCWWLVPNKLLVNHLVSSQTKNVTRSLRAQAKHKMSFRYQGRICCLTQECSGEHQGTCKTKSFPEGSPEPFIFDCVSLKQNPLKKK